MEGERVPVLDLGRYGRVWLLSVTGRDAVVAPEDLLCHGWGLPYPRPFSAAFVHRGQLWFQVGRDRWDVSQIASVQQLEETIWSARYELSFTDETRRRVKVRFPPVVAIMRMIDITHDEMESWSEDIMKMLPYTAADGWSAGDADIGAWAEHVMPMWSKGFAPRT